MSRRLLYILIGIVVLLLIGIGVATFIILSSAKNSQTAATTTTAATSTAKAKHTPNPVQQAMQQNATPIRAQFAQGLHLTPDQLHTQLQSGQSLDSIATAQGLSSDQLQTLIHDSVEQNLTTVINSGTITQKQVDAAVQRLQKNHTAFGHFLAGGNKNSNGTPNTPTPTATPTT